MFTLIEDHTNMAIEAIVQNLYPINFCGFTVFFPKKKKQ